MERKIGEIFEYNGEWYQCLESNRCDYCDLEGLVDCSTTACTSGERSDSKEVHFKKLKKVGEPYEKRVSDGTFSKFQRYKVYNSVILPKEPYIYCNFIDSTVEIETKQVKDMGERDDIRPYDEYFSQGTVSNKKHLPKSNLKPFDLQKAKDGKPVCTRDGRKARIICFDRVTNSTNEYTGHLIVLVTNPNGDEQSFYYTEKGNLAGEDEYDNHKWDLMMLPEKKEGWVNVYNADTTFYYVEGMVYNTKDEAIQKAKEEITTEQREKSEYVDTVKINWEE